MCCELIVLKCLLYFIQYVPAYIPGAHSTYAINLYLVIAGIHNYMHSAKKIQLFYSLSPHAAHMFDKIHLYFLTS